MLFDKRWELDAVGRVMFDAATYMDNHGWCQRARYRSDGSVCILGALVHITQGNFDLRAECRTRLMRHLKMNEAAWNDSVCKSKEQAVAALRDAATSVR